MWYVPNKEKRGNIFGTPAVTYKHTGELCVAGRYGEIHQYSDTHFQVFLYAANVASRVTGKPFKRGEETIIRPIAALEMERWLKIIKAPPSLATQARLANGRNGDQKGAPNGTFC